MIYDWGKGSGFGWRGRWRNWRKIVPKYVEKALISKQALISYWGPFTNWI